MHSTFLDVFPYGIYGVVQLMWNPRRIEIISDRNIIIIIGTACCLLIIKMWLQLNIVFLKVCYFQSLLLAIIALPKEVIFLCVCHTTCKLLLYAQYDQSYFIESYSALNVTKKNHPSIHTAVNKNCFLQATSAPALLSVPLPSHHPSIPTSTYLTV